MARRLLRIAFLSALFSLPVGCSERKAAEVPAEWNKFRLEIEQRYAKAGRICDVDGLYADTNGGMAIRFVSVDDLSPLKGLALTSLSCLHAKVSDISSLEGMPLRNLSIPYTSVTNIAVLKGMPIENLCLAGTHH